MKPRTLKKKETEKVTEKNTEKKKKDRFDEVMDMLEKYDEGTPPRSAQSNDWGE